MCPAICMGEEDNKQNNLLGPKAHVSCRRTMEENCKSKLESDFGGLWNPSKIFWFAFE